MTFSDILIGAEHQFPPLYNGKCNPYILEVLSILNEVMHENGLAECIAQNRFSLNGGIFFFSKSQCALSFMSYKSSKYKCV